MRLSPRNRIILGLVLLAGVTQSGCALPLAHLMVNTPNRFNPFAGRQNPIPSMESLSGLVDQTFPVTVGPPEATLAVSIVEPQGVSQPKGTILVLHGILARSYWMLPAARSLSEAGYRVALVDLRGHGRSSGEHLTFGVREAKDLSQVLDVLQERRLLAGQVGVYGISYGATTSIHLAGYDSRIKAVVAVAPFSTMRDEVPHFGRVMVPGLGWVIPDPIYQKAIDEAGQIAEFDPDRADATEAIRRTSAQVLLVHGTNDWVVPHRNSQRLHDAAPDHSQLISVPAYGHIIIWVDPTCEVARYSRDWFDRWLTAPPANSAS
ncbi:MAG: alpha/beta fold hydrolase [Pirellulales bacterium]|nr:alpha/beta fold hydrolase [Pirellulales bacterium]